MPLPSGAQVMLETAVGWSVRAFASPPMAFNRWIWVCSSSPRRARKAMRLPSGDQRGLVSPFSPLVTWIRLPPSASTLQMWARVPFSSQSASRRTKSSRVPSGEMRGSPSVGTSIRSTMVIGRGAVSASCADRPCAGPDRVTNTASAAAAGHRGTLRVAIRDGDVWCTFILLLQASFLPPRSSGRTRGRRAVFLIRSSRARPRASPRPRPRRTGNATGPDRSSGACGAGSWPPARGFPGAPSPFRAVSRS